MTKRTIHRIAVSLIFMAAASPGWAQADPGTLHRWPVMRSSQDAPGFTPTTYTYTLFEYPGTFYSYATAMNVSGTLHKYEIVGTWGTDSLIPGNSWFAHFSGTSAILEKYQGLAVPPATQSGAFGVNTPGQIVGQYLDSSLKYHGFEQNGSTFTTLDVPFTGATGTFTGGINDSGEIVGGYNDASQIQHGFTLIGGVYTSFDYPGGSGTVGNSLNNKGNIVGYWTDASGNEHAFSLISGVYANVDPPGSTFAYAAGIDDNDDVVGAFCTTAGCRDTQANDQGFLLRGGVYTYFSLGGMSTGLSGINNKGVILGGYSDSAGYVHNFVAVP